MDYRRAEGKPGKEGKKMNNKNKTPAGPGLGPRIRPKLTKREEMCFRGNLFICLFIYYPLKIC